MYIGSFHLYFGEDRYPHRHACVSTITSFALLRCSAITSGVLTFAFLYVTRLNIYYIYIYTPWRKVESNEERKKQGLRIFSVYTTYTEYVPPPEPMMPQASPKMGSAPVRSSRSFNNPHSPALRCCRCSMPAHIIVSPFSNRLERNWKLWKHCRPMRCDVLK